MKHSKLEHDLAAWKEDDPAVLPDAMRRCFDEAYTSLGHIDVARCSRRRTWFRGTAVAVAGAALASILIIGSGFVFPEMARSLEKIPIVRYMYKLAGDIGLQTAAEQGMSVSVNERVTHNGITMSVSEVLFDGVRISLVLHQEGADRKRDIAYISALINGQAGPYSYQLTPSKPIGDEQAKAALLTIGHAGYDHAAGTDYQFPETFELTLHVELDGMKGDVFEFRLPIRKDGSDRRVIVPEASKTFDGVELDVHQIEVSPATLQLFIHERAHSTLSHASGMPKIWLYKEIPSLQFTVVDDRGIVLRSLSSGGRRAKDGVWSNEAVYALPGRVPESITIKPYLDLNGPGTSKTAEKDIPVIVDRAPSSDNPLVLNAKGGRLSITGIEQEKDKIRVYSTAQGAEPYLLAGSLWIVDENGERRAFNKLLVQDEAAYRFVTEYDNLTAGKRLTVGMWEYQHLYIQELEMNVPLNNKNEQDLTK